MKSKDFLEALEEAGWEGVHDAQHEKIQKLWKRLFPVVAQVEEELREEEAYTTELATNLYDLLLENNR